MMEDDQSGDEDSSDYEDDDDDDDDANSRDVMGAAEGTRTGRQLVLTS